MPIWAWIVIGAGFVAVAGIVIASSEYYEDTRSASVDKNYKHWDLIQKYSAACIVWSELLALHEDGTVDPVVEAEQKMDEARDELLDFMGLEALK